MPQSLLTDIKNKTGRRGPYRRTLSFKGALEAFQPLIAYVGDHGSTYRRSLFYQELLDAISSHRVAHRPDRFEPRKKKRRRSPYDLLTKSRKEAKRDILKGRTKTKRHSVV